jgi:hypothetical protein
MTDSVFTYRMPAGIPGAVNRKLGGAVITPEIQNATTPVTEYGVPVILDASGARPVAATDTSNDVEAGFSARPFPGTDLNYGLVNAGAANPGFGSGTPPNTGEIDIMRKGFIVCKIGGSTAAAKYGNVYVWTAASSGAHVQGHVEASSPGGSGFQLTRARFRGPADASGNVEVEYRI